MYSTKTFQVPQCATLNITDAYISVCTRQLSKHFTFIKLLHIHNKLWGGTFIIPFYAWRKKTKFMQLVGDKVQIWTLTPEYMFLTSRLCCLSKLCQKVFTQLLRTCHWRWNRVFQSRDCIFLFIVMFTSPMLIRIMPANTPCSTHPIHNA